MTNVRKTYDAIASGRGTITFADLQRLLGRLGFQLARISGSHHIYIHPDVTRPVNIQSDGKDAKPYQVRQVRNIIEQFDLKLED